MNQLSLVSGQMWNQSSIDVLWVCNYKNIILVQSMTENVLYFLNFRFLIGSKTDAER